MRPEIPDSAGLDVDRENPWPGLASFTEELRGFFFGRERETEELVRLVHRETLTVLFGQSGLGKSSLLQAGVFPVLRQGDFLPLYLRLDHDASAPALADQVKAALVEAVRLAGASAPVPHADESLWEYFHRKDINIWSTKNRLLTPVLAFDQFEEIFTLGRVDDLRRQRSRAFLTELADLVENRPPSMLRAKFDSGALDTTRYAFDKPSCQVILSLREDFLPDLEGLKGEMRSLMFNRMRIRRLTGNQALEIVTRPAPNLIADGVAEKVVEFVAGDESGSPDRMAELEVEPALLSVICRELNQRRRTLGQAQITPDLVSGNRREILNDFYERSVSDLPTPVREFVEDRLLTKSGYRDSVALETVLEVPGVTRPVLDTLVSRRLLRIEDRAGVQRVELTHDVLADVVRTNRDSRLELRVREASEQKRREAEAELKEARAREAEARRSAIRARIVAIGCSVLMILTAGAAAWGYINFRRATAAQTAALHAEAEAQSSRKQGDLARRQAEQLLTYLQGEFQIRLFASGQLELFEQLARRTVDYYEQLPAILVSDSTDRNHALSLALLGSVLYREDQIDGASKFEDESIALFRKRKAAGDDSEELAKGLSFALKARAQTYDNQGQPEKSAPSFEESAAILRPFLADPRFRAEITPLLADRLMYIGFNQMGAKDSEKPKSTLLEAAGLMSAAGGFDPKNEDVAVGNSTLLMVLSYLFQSDHEKELQYAKQALQIQNAVLERDPGRLDTIAQRAGSFVALATLADNEKKIAEEMGYLTQATQDFQFYMRLNPRDAKTRADAVDIEVYTANILYQLGRLDDARKFLNGALKEGEKLEISTGYYARLMFLGYWRLAEYAASAGDRDGAESALANLKRYEMQLCNLNPTDQVAVLSARFEARFAKLSVEAELGADAEAIQIQSRAIIDDLIKEWGGNKKPEIVLVLRHLTAAGYRALTSASLDRGEYREAAEAAVELLQDIRPTEPNHFAEEEDENLELSPEVAKADQAEAMVAQGQKVMALQILEPLVLAARNETAKEPENVLFRLDLADRLVQNEMALDALALEKRTALLGEARLLLANVPKEMKTTRLFRRTQARFGREQANLAAGQ